MQYKYSRKQLFGKRLKVPKEILRQVYESKLSFEDFIKYNLEDKIPISCLKIPDRKIVERFGIEKSKTLDWELLIKNPSTYTKNNTQNFGKVSEALLQIEPNVVDLNKALYEKVKKFVSPIYYSEKMKEECPELISNFSQLHFDNVLNLFDDIITNWELLKDKDLSYFLNNDISNKYGITDSQLKECMNKYNILIKLLNSNADVYSFIHQVATLENNELQEYLRDTADSIIEKVGSYKYLTNEQYEKLFKYTSLKEYLKKFNSNYLIDELFKELETLPPNYIFDTKIPISYFKKDKVLNLINIFGLKNIVDFDNECGHFFSRNDWNNLEDIYSFYDNNITILFHKQINARRGYDKDYTREKFYEDMRKIIIYSRSGENYDLIMSSRKDITGRFRGINHDLFISGKAPEELKDAFYTKKITPHLIAEHREYIPYLRGKNLTSSFQTIKNIVVKGVDDNIYMALFDFLYKKVDFDELMNFIIEYRDVFDILEKSNFFLNFEIDASFEEIKKEIISLLRKEIVEYGVKYPNNIPSDLEKYYPNMVLPSDAPKELKDALYNRSINVEFINSNPNYRKYLENIDFDVVFKKMPIEIRQKLRRIDTTTISNVMEKIFGHKDAFDIMLRYGIYIEKCYELNKFFSINFDNLNITKDELLEKIDSIILKNIIDGNITYKDDMPEHFKINNPTLFLSGDVPDNIRTKFYNRELTFNDFNDNPNLLDLLGNTNICLGISVEFLWVFPLFNEETNSKTANVKRLKIILVYSKIQDASMKEVFKNFIEENINDFDIKKLPYVEELLSRISKSNSIDLLNIRSSLASNLLKTDDPLENFSKIEKIFVKNNLPLFGKIFMSFQILYPDLVKIDNLGNNKFDFTDDSRMSPELKEQSLGNVRFGKTSNEKRFNIIFNDLLRIAYRSNNRSFMDYLENIEIGNNLYLNIIHGQIDINKLEQKEEETLNIFVKHLQTLFENTVKGSKEIIDLEKYSLIERVEILSKLFGVNKNFDLKDRIVRSFCYSAGIKSFDELKQLALSATKEADARGRRYARELEGGKKFVFENGDFIRGVGYYQVLNKSLNSGNVSKEFLSIFTGESNSDTTPLDVDISLISDVNNNTTIYDVLSTGSARATGFGFGNIYVVIKKDNPHFYITRDKDGNLTHQQYDPLKNELFGTKLENSGTYEGHWGVRTGIAFTDVDYILYKKDLKINEKQPYDENGNVNYMEENSEIYDDLSTIKFEIARNGYYIPIIDFSGRLIFTEKEYDDLRKKMAGLSYYGVPEYTVSNNLDLDNGMQLKDEILSSQIKIKKSNRQLVNLIIDVLDGLTVYMGFNPDLTENTAELYCTGSTSRNTNIPYDSDFDFLIRIDREIYDDEQKLNKLKSKFKEKMGLKDGFGGKVVGTILDEEGNLLDVEISFVPRTDKLDYSTDRALGERLNNIQEQYPELYQDIIANIVFAKKLLKANGVYKTAKSDKTQGGMGGVGIENWILQHGGSFYDASVSFLEAAEGKSFQDFIKTYQVWDFGSNHYSEKKGIYPHENFIYETTKNSEMLKMTEDGYNKMVQVLREYVNNYNQIQTVSMKK